MPQWYRIVIESDNTAQAEAQANSFESELANALEPMRQAAPVEVYYDWLPNRRGRVFWLSAGAFDGALELARRYRAEPFLGLVDKRFLVSLFD